MVWDRCNSEVESVGESNRGRVVASCPLYRVIRASARLGVWPLPVSIRFNDWGIEQGAPGISWACTAAVQ